jgi:urate oxidase
VHGDNRACLPTDTMKNTVYALARQDPVAHVEAFALRLAGHFLSKPAVSRVRVAAVEDEWAHHVRSGQPDPHAFVLRGGEQWTTTVTREAHRTEIVSGLSNLVVMKTSRSAFAGFPRDEYTTLPDAGDRILATSIAATWTYRSPDVDFDVRRHIRSTLLDAFAQHDSRSVQHTLHAMAEAALAASADVTSITLTLPNRHHLLADLNPFGLDNPNEVFVAIDQPFGLIEATVTRR